MFLLNDPTDQKISNIIYDGLMHLDMKFSGLVGAINDYNKYKEPIIAKVLSSGTDLPLKEIENNELKRLLDSIYSRLDKINFKFVSDKLNKHLKERFPQECWITITTDIN